MSVTEKFHLIDTLAFPYWYSLGLNGILVPALTAAAYICLYPYPAKFVYAFTRNRQKEINDIRRLIENQTPLTLEESCKIRADAIRKDDEHSQEIDLKNQEIGRPKQLTNKYV